MPFSSRWIIILLQFSASWRFPLTLVGILNVKDIQAQVLGVVLSAEIVSVTSAKFPADASHYVIELQESLSLSSLRPFRLLKTMIVRDGMKTKFFLKHIYNEKHNLEIYRMKLFIGIFKHITWYKQILWANIFCSPPKAKHWVRNLNANRSNL